MSNPGTYLHALDAELRRAAVPHATRARIVAEFADHFACDAESDLSADPTGRLGEPREIARQFADELGTDLARRAAFTAFSALAVAGILALYAVTRLDFTGAGRGWAAACAVLGGVVAAQVSLISGGLALVRGLWLRGRRVIARSEAAILSRRAGVALAAGAVTLVCLPVAASSQRSGSGVALTVTLAASLGLAAIAAAAPTSVRAARLRPQAGGPAGDLFTDLGPAGALASAVSSGSTVRLARLIATCLFVVVAGAGWLQNDGYDGMIRAAFEAGACYGAFALLGGYLGLRRR